jgi:D-psicose/D-tagatose/L-ribulose 3-epimerase
MMVNVVERQNSRPSVRGGDFMRLGCCGNMIDPARDPIGIEIVERLAGIGFDYVELSLADLAALPEEEFARLLARVERSGIRCEACNNFFPRRIRLTGTAARLDDALGYAGPALERAARLGASIIVFGSSGAKNVPEGFSKGDAWGQIVKLLQHLGPLAQAHGITIAIEPISRPESNIVNCGAEGLRLVQEVGHPAVQLLIDFYHLMVEHEDPGIVVEAGGTIRHLHFAKVEGRVFPTGREDAGTMFFDRLRRIGYQGRCSIEAFTGDFTSDASRALRLLHAEMEGKLLWSD